MRNSLLMLMLLLVMMLAAVRGDCPKHYLSISYVDVSGSTKNCEIKGSDLVSDGASVSTACHITCRCQTNVIQCCYNINKQCMHVEDSCDGVESYKGLYLYCANTNQMEMDEPIPVRNI